MSGPEPSPEARAAGLVAQRLVAQAVGQLKRRELRNPGKLVIAIQEDRGLTDEYRAAVARHDAAMMDALRFTAAGLLSEHMTAPVLAFLLSRSEAADGDWAGAIVSALREARVIG